MKEDKKLYNLSVQLGMQLKKNNEYITCAESCTGGWVAKVITDVPGSSHWFDRGFITYGNKAKHELLGVQHKTMKLYGAVSSLVAQEMACRALYLSSSNYSVSITGVAGPGGGTNITPIGTFWFSFADKNNNILSYIKYFKGNRCEIRYQAVYFALHKLLTIFF